MEKAIKLSQPWVTNGRKLLVLTRIGDYDRQARIRIMIPIDNVEAIDGFKDGRVVVHHTINGELRPITVEESFSDIMNGKHTVEL